MNTIASSTDRTIHPTLRCVAHLTTAMMVWCAINVLYILIEAKPSIGDALLFKEAGINMAVHGNFSSAPTSDFHGEPTDSYPLLTPLYPFIYGLYSGVFGVGLKQSILFDHVLKFGRTFLLFLFLWPWLKPRLNFGDLKGRVVLFLLVPISILPYYNDHPEDLGLLFGLWSWYLIRNNPSNFGRWILSGILGGLTFGTSLLAGFFFCIGASAYVARADQKVARIAAWWLSCLGLFSLCVLPLILLEPVVWQKPAHFFMKSLAPYPDGNWLAGMQLSFAGSRYFKPILVPWFSLWLLVGLALLLYGKRDHQNYKKAFSPFFMASFIFIPLVLSFWPLQPKYLWLPGFVLFGATIGLWVQEQEKGRPILVAATFLVALIPPLFVEGAILFQGIEQPASQSAKAIREKVLSYVENDAKLVVTSDQYFTFRVARPVALTTFACSRIEQYDYVYMSNVDKGDRTPMIGCPTHRECFTVQADLRERYPISLFGLTIPLTLPGNGGVLFKNTTCPRHPNYVSLLTK